MKTKDFAKALWAFAELVDHGRAEELHLLAKCFEDGSNETLLARFKRMSPSKSHPATLKASLTAIHSALKAVGAKKQAGHVADFLNFYAGRPGSTVEQFLREISEPSPNQATPPPYSKKIDHRRAASILDELGAPSQEADSITRLVAQLNDRALVDTPTLAFISHAYLKDGHAFRDRKTAVAAIAKRYTAEAQRRAELFAAAE